MNIQQLLESLYQRPTYPPFSSSPLYSSFLTISFHDYSWAIRKLLLISIGNHQHNPAELDIFLPRHTIPHQAPWTHLHDRWYMVLDMSLDNSTVTCGPITLHYLHGKMPYMERHLDAQAEFGVVISRCQLHQAEFAETHVNKMSNKQNLFLQPPKMCGQLSLTSWMK